MLEGYTQPAEPQSGAKALSQGTAPLLEFPLSLMPLDKTCPYDHFLLLWKTVYQMVLPADDLPASGAHGITDQEKGSLQMHETTSIKRESTEGALECVSSALHV